MKNVSQLSTSEIFSKPSISDVDYCSALAIPKYLNNFDFYLIRSPNSLFCKQLFWR